MPKAVVFNGAGRPLEIVEFLRPEPLGSETLVKVACCTLCRSDLHTHAGRRVEPTPTVLGHEIVGRIEAFGPDASRLDATGSLLNIGDRVSWCLAVGCGECFFCADGLPQKCERLYKYGHERLSPDHPPVGGLSDFVILVPGTPCYRVPDAIPDHVAASANCSTATAAAVIRTAGEIIGRTVLVLGGGVLGLTVSAMSRTLGARAVMVSDPDPERRRRSLSFGASHALGTGEELAVEVREATQNRGADIIFELAGLKVTTADAFKLARIGGTIILAGTVAPVGTIPFDPEQMVRRMLTIRGVHNYHPSDLAKALAFLAHEGRDFPWADLVSARYPLEDANEAFSTAHAQPGVRVAIVPGLSSQEPA